MGFDLYLFTNLHFYSTLVAGGAMAHPPAESATVTGFVKPSFAGDDSKEYTTWKNELEKELERSDRRGQTKARTARCYGIDRTSQTNRASIEG